MSPESCKSLIWMSQPCTKQISKNKYIASFTTPATRGCWRVVHANIDHDMQESAGKTNATYFSTRALALTTRMLSSPCLFWSGRLLGILITFFSLLHEASFTGKICSDRTKVTPSVQG